MALPSSHGIHGRSTRHPRADQGVTPGIELVGDPFSAAGHALRVTGPGSEHVGSSNGTSMSSAGPGIGSGASALGGNASYTGAVLHSDTPLVMSPPMQQRGELDAASPAQKDGKLDSATSLDTRGDDGFSGRNSSHGNGSNGNANGKIAKKNAMLADIDTRAAAHEPMRSNSGSRRGTHDFSDTSKRPTSPHITIATPTSARFHLSHQQLQSEKPGRAYSLPAGQGRTSSASPIDASGNGASPARRSSSKGASAHGHPSAIDGTMGGRSTPSAKTLSRPGSASASSRRRSENTSAPHEHMQGAALGVFLDDDADLYDDEQGKGHGFRRASAGPSSGRWTPTILSSIMKRAEGRFSPVSPFAAAQAALSHAHHDSHKITSPSKGAIALAAEPEALTEDDIKHAEHSRRTPARYRPANEGIAKSAGMHNEMYTNGTTSLSSQGKAHPLSHAHKVSVSSMSNSSHSINMNSPPMSSHSRHSSQHASVSAGLSPPLLGTRIVGSGASSASPLVVPQARRGAMNLRPLRRRKRGAARQQARVVSPSVPIHLRFIRFIRLLCFAIIHPLRTCVHAKQSFVSTLRSIDQAFRDPRTGARVWQPSWLSAYIPLLIWLVISLSSTFTVLIWHTQVFQGLDRLSLYLQGMGMSGRLILGFLIFLTTFPPLPLYSTLIILCGFTFGLWQGFIISYIAALSGAITVFLLSRSLLKGWMLNLLNKSGGLKRVVRAIEKRPKLLFLVRLAPYPYNLMNTLLASSPTLTLKTYTTCTALALPKLLVHCGLGTTIKNFAAYNGAARSLDSDAVDAPASGTSTIIGKPVVPDASASETAELIKHIFGFVGVGLCIGIFVYLLRVARKAVDEELDDEEDGEDDYELVLSDEEEEMCETGGERVRLSAAHASSNEFVIGEDSYEHDQTPGPGRTAWAQRSKGVAHRDGKDVSSHDSAMSRLSAVPPRSESSHRFITAADGTTPMFVVPPQLDGLPHDSGSDTGRSYFGRQSGAASVPMHPRSLGMSNKGHSSSTLSDSQGSLADSILELEKHATLMEGRPSQQGYKPSNGRAHGDDVKSTLLRPSTHNHTPTNSTYAQRGNGASPWPQAAHDLLDDSRDDDFHNGDAERKPFVRAIQT